MLIRTGLSLSLLLVACSGAKEKQLLADKDAELEKLRTERNACQRTVDTEKEEMLRRAKALRARARDRVALKADWQIQRLAQFETLLDGWARDPEQAARVENNILSRIQRLAQFYVETVHYEPTDDNGLLVDPVKATVTMKSLVQAIASQVPADKRENAFTNGLMHQLGDEEAIAVKQIDLLSIK
jgi:hypothetical protein